MPKEFSFPTTVVSLWCRLTTLAIIALVFAQGLYLASGKAEGWTYFLPSLDVGFEVVVHLVIAAATGLVLGSLCTAILAPVLWPFQSSRPLLAQRAVQVAVILVVFLDSRFALTILIKMSNYGARFATALLTIHFLVFVVALFIPRGRKELVASLDGFLGGKRTLRIIIATGAAALALVFTEFAFARTMPSAQAAQGTRPKSNVLLITFDALGAEEMSLYGRELPTTPKMIEFARKSTVFTNFFSASTFTTPGVASILTGSYPSESKVFQLEGRLPAANNERNVAHLMHAGGYATGAFITSPYAYYLAAGFEKDYDELPEPVFAPGSLHRLWQATRPLHQDSGLGSRIVEYFDIENAWSFFGRLPNDPSMRYRPAASFEQARKLLSELPDGFFLWVHVVSPHTPYAPDATDRGRFHHSASQERVKGGRYQAYQQGEVDGLRLRYDEFIATTDRAFGDFISELEGSGKLRDTTVIVSADHGESFEGGYYEHGGTYQTRPVIHIPLIVRTPGQQEGRRVAFAADQTVLAPTILDLGGQPKPEYMSGQSLGAWLKGDSGGDGQGLAFTQYLETNSVFQRPRRGSVGVIDGHYQYVLDIATQKGVLRPLNEAQLLKTDRSAEHPDVANTLRAALYARFPDLLRK